MTNKLTQFVQEHKAELNPPFADKDMMLEEDIHFMAISIGAYTGQYGKQWVIDITTFDPCTCYMEEVVVTARGKLPTTTKQRGKLPVSDMRISFSDTRARTLILGQFLKGELEKLGSYGPLHLERSGNAVDIADVETGTDELDTSHQNAVESVVSTVARSANARKSGDDVPF